MKRSIVLFASLFCCIAISAQGYWKKESVTDDFYNTKSTVICHYCRGGLIDAVWYKDEKMLKMINEYPSQKSFDVTFDASYHNNGHVASRATTVDINCSGKIYEDFETEIIYPKADESSFYFFGSIFFDMTREEMTKGSFVSVRYYDPLLEDVVVQKISLSGFSSALNGTRSQGSRSHGHRRKK